MPKKYQKKKSEEIPNATGPKYRTPSRFIGNKFSSSSKFGNASQKGFRPPQFKKTQHKG